MSTVPKRNIWLLLAMLICAGAAFGLTPRQKIADLHPMPVLETTVPSQFGQWRQVPTTNQVIDPNQKHTLERIYDQTLARTYINPQGYRIMLSMAYGGNQRDELELHKPEVCYVAQGFVLDEKFRTQLQFENHNIPVTRLNLHQGSRIEPVTYWATVGSKVVNNGYTKKWVEIQYGMAGKIADGILVRISSIDEDRDAAYTQHDQFAEELLASISDDLKHKLLGDN